MEVEAMPRPATAAPATDPSFAVAYLRLNTEGRGIGIKAQRDAVQKWTAMHGITVAAWHEDRMRSGTRLDTRPGLVGALADVAALGAGVLVVARRDCLSRDPVLAAMAEGAAARTGARVVSAMDAGANQHNPDFVLIRRIVDACTDYDRLLASARTTPGLPMRPHGGNVPYGSRFSADGVHLEACPEEIAAMDAARELRADGLSLRAIGARLEARGMLPRSGGRWHAKVIRDIVRR